MKRRVEILDETVVAPRRARPWRVTAPLRALAHQVRRIKPFVRMPPVVQQAGGLWNMAGKMIGLYRLEGIGGLKRGFLIVYSLSRKRNNYAKWIRRYDTLTDADRAAMRAAIRALARKPLISVVMPTYNSKPEWLIAAIESVRRQIYPHWQLCIADDASTDAAVRPILQRYAREDPRIKVVFRERNGHISAASNSALDLVAGEWVALLDHDDVLAEHALFWVARAVDRHPEARLIYSDEDKLNADGQRCEPYFKCDWNIDLFYSHNLFSHLGVYSTTLVREVGGFREGFEGSQDYDLALRCLERIRPSGVHHIPRVLYHWRTHAESTAHDSEAKPYAMLAGERALNEHLGRRGVAAHVELIGHGYRIHYALPDSPPRVSLIIPTRNKLPLVRQCVASILEKTTYPHYEILIVDNGSDDPATLRYFEEIAADARVRVVRDDRPFNFSALNNAAVRRAKGAVIGLINNDIEVIAPDWLSEMVSLALQPSIGAVGARLWYPNDTLQHGGILLGVGGLAAHAHKHGLRHEYGFFGRASLVNGFSAVTAACLVIRKSIYQEVGGLNETDLQVAYNDVDFCLRVREAGYRTVWTPYADLYHHESASRGSDDAPAKQVRLAKEIAYMKERWNHILLKDPAYSPNLTFDREDFSLAWPPRIEPIASPVPDSPEIRLEAAVPGGAAVAAEEHAGQAVKEDALTWLPANGAPVPAQCPAAVGRAAAASQAAAAMRLPMR